MKTSINKTNRALSLLVLLLIGTIGTLFYNKAPSMSQVKPSFNGIDMQLREFIPIYTKAAQQPWKKISLHQSLKLGVNHPEVAILRERLVLIGELTSIHATGNLFDKDLETAVRHFQQRHGIEASGTINPATLAALNVSPRKRLNQIQANIQRWEKLQQNQSSHFLWVNIPEYKARLIEDDKVTLNERVIIGKPSSPTPEITSQITEVMLNPYWIVPNSLAKQSVMPKALDNPSYLNENNIRVFQANNQQELVVNDIDWSSLSAHYTDYFFRQEPGPKNPLGKIKFKITNKNSIYLHDTSSKNLFEQSQRALSSGCIRIQNPFLLFAKLAEYDSSIDKKNNDVIKALKSGETLNINLKKPLTIYVTYITAWVDADGDLNFRNDIYQRDTA